MWYPVKGRVFSPHTTEAYAMLAPARVWMGRWRYPVVVISKSHRHTSESNAASQRLKLILGSQKEHRFTFSDYLAPRLHWQSQDRQYWGL